MVYIPANDKDGAVRWVSEEYERLARIVQDYDQAFELRWIPPEHRTRDDKKPYVVVDTTTERPIVYASELDSPTDILATIFQSDMKQGNVLERIEARERAEKIIQLKERHDRLEELLEKYQWMAESNLNYMKVDGKKYDSERRVIG